MDVSPHYYDYCTVAKSGNSDHNLKMLSVQPVHSLHKCLLSFHNVQGTVLGEQEITAAHRAPRPTWSLKIV